MERGAVNTPEVQRAILNDLVVLLDARERKTGWEWVKERAALSGAGDETRAARTPTQKPAPLSAVQMELE